MELPLFPLNSVLFPGMPMRLYIFEERYKTMINECIDNQAPFGIVLIESGREALGPLASPHLVGTTAHITEVQKLPLGRMNIIAVGRDRFRVQTLDVQTKPYLLGDVDLIPFSTALTPAAVKGGRLLRPLVARYLTALEKSAMLNLAQPQLPHDPLALAYLGAMLLQSENNTKQNLLESDDTPTLLTQLIGLYRTEVVIMELLMSPPQVIDEDTPFSPN